MLHEKGRQFSLQNAWFFVSKLKNFYFFWRVVLTLPQIMKVNLLVRVTCVFRTHVRQFCVQAINFQWKYTYFYFLTLSLSSWNCPVGLGLGLTIPKTSTLSINRNPYNSLFEESYWWNSLAEKKIRALHRSGRRRRLNDNLIKGRKVYSAGCMESAVGVVIPRKSLSKKYP